MLFPLSDRVGEQVIRLKGRGEREGAKATGGESENRNDNHGKFGDLMVREKEEETALRQERRHAGKSKN